MNEDCTQIVKHLNRIQGQIDALKEFVEQGKPCEDVAHLTKSIMTSFSSVRARIVQQMLAKELKLSSNKRDMRTMQNIVALYKS